MLINNLQKDKSQRLTFYKGVRHTYDFVSRFFWWVYGLRTESHNLTFPLWIDDPRKIKIGSGTHFGPYVHVTVQNPKGYLQIGQNCEINPFSSFLCGNGVEIGDNVLIGPHFSVITSSNSYIPGWLIALNPHIGGKVLINSNVHIGANVTILPGVSIGEGTVIGAGSIVNKDLPSGVIAFGVPCKIYRQRPRG